MPDSPITEPVDPVEPVEPVEPVDVPGRATDVPTQRTAPDTSTPAPAPLRWTWRSPRLWVVIALVVLIAAGAQTIGAVTVPIGIASLTVLPLVWGLLAGGLVSSQPWRRFPLDLQSAASTIMGVAVLLLCARLAFTMGPNISALRDAGPALLLQEVGHMFGTLVLALPLAVLLRMGPATVGATFSIDREGAFAMVSERFGPDSPQYRGVLSMYAFGTLFGAMIITLIASIAVSLDFLDPLALAMGSGVGSGSMMAAASAAVAEAHPELGDQVLAVAATSNVITGMLGVYVGMYVALPLAERYYQAITRRQKPRPASASTARAAAPTVQAPPVRVPLWTILTLLVLVGTAVSAISTRSFDPTVIGGLLVLVALVAAGIGISRLTRGKLNAMFGVITLGTLLSTPWSPVDGPLLDLVSAVDFHATCTIILTIAGLSLGKDLPMLRAIGWKIIPVGLVSITSAYLLASTVAHLALTIW